MSLYSFRARRQFQEEDELSELKQVSGKTCILNVCFVTTIFHGANLTHDSKFDG